MRREGSCECGVLGGAHLERVHCLHGCFVLLLELLRLRLKRRAKKVKEKTRKGEFNKRKRRGGDKVGGEESKGNEGEGGGRGWEKEQRVGKGGEDDLRLREIVSWSH